MKDAGDGAAADPGLGDEATRTRSGIESPFVRDPDSPRLTSGSSLLLTLAAFGAYFCMYAFRKPFTAAGWAEHGAFGVEGKTALVTAQVLGYTVSKFLGIPIIGGMRKERRVAFLLLLVGIAELALIVLAWVPPRFGIVLLFLNGLPLGMVFGLVLGCLEGRRLTEAMTAALCASFILADGVTKSVGAWLLEVGVPEVWMPATAGGLFLIPLLASAALLNRSAGPDQSDVALRSERTPMDRAERRQFARRHASVLLGIVSLYLLITILRSVRADFAPELWAALGYRGESSVFARSEVLVALGVLVVNGAAVRLVDNRRGFAYGLFVAGMGLLLVATVLAVRRPLGVPAFTFMVILGLGLYLPYVAVHTTLFERLVAMTRDRANIGYLMYLADSVGYLGYVVLMLVRGAVPTGESFLDFFVTTAWTVALLGALALACCVIWFRGRASRSLQLSEGPVDRRRDSGPDRP